MVQYYNFSVFANNEGVIGFWKGLSSLTHEIFPLFILGTAFTVTVVYYTNKSRREGEILAPNEAIHLASFYTFLLGLMFYVSEIVHNSQYVYIPALVYAITGILRWINRD